MCVCAWLYVCMCVYIIMWSVWWEFSFIDKLWKLKHAFYFHFWRKKNTLKISNPSRWLFKKIEFSNNQSVLYNLFDNSHILYIDCLVGWGCRIHRLHICREVRPLPNECPGYDTKQSDGEVLVMLELWGIRSNPSLSLLPGPLWPGVVATDKALFMG